MPALVPAIVAQNSHKDTLLAPRARLQADDDWDPEYRGRVAPHPEGGRRPLSFPSIGATPLGGRVQRLI